MANPWLEHVKKVHKANPGKKFKEILIMAKKSYKSVESEVSKAVVGKKHHKAKTGKHHKAKTGKHHKAKTGKHHKTAKKSKKGKKGKTAKKSRKHRK